MTAEEILAALQGRYRVAVAEDLRAFAELAKAVDRSAANPDSYIARQMHREAALYCAETQARRREAHACLVAAGGSSRG